MGFEFLDTEKAEMWAPAAAAGKLWLHGFFKFDWRDTFIKIDSIKPSGKGYLVTRDAKTPPCYGFVTGCRFYAVGALELLDVPGEYHVDKDTGTLHFLPPTPLGADSDVLVSVLATVLEANNVNHTSWKDMTISVARGKVVQVTGGHNVQVSNCTVTNAGSTCLSMDAGTNHTAHGNTVRPIVLSTPCDKVIMSFLMRLSLTDCLVGFRVRWRWYINQLGRHQHAGTRQQCCHGQYDHQL